MAYNEKYYINIDDPYLGSGKISIQKDGYSGSSSELILKENGLIWKYQFKNWETRILGLTLDLKIVNNFDDYYELDDLIFVYNNQYKVIFTLDNHPNWGEITLFNGFIEPKASQQDYEKLSTVHLQCSSYLNKLKEKQPVILETFGYGKLLDLIFHILGQTGNELPVVVNSYLKYKLGDDPNIYSVFDNAWIEKALWRKNNEDFENSYKVLEDILKAYDCYLYFWDNQWYIENFNSLVGDENNNYEKVYQYFDSSTSDASTIYTNEEPLYFSEEQWLNNTVDYQLNVKKFELKLSEKKWDNLVLPDYENMTLYEGDEPYDEDRVWLYTHPDINVEQLIYGEMRGDLEVGFRLENYDRIEPLIGYVTSYYPVTVAPKGSDSESTLKINFGVYGKDNGTSPINDLNVSQPFYLRFDVEFPDLDETFSSVEGGLDSTRLPYTNGVNDVELEYNLSELLDLDATSNVRFNLQFRSLEAREDFEGGTYPKFPIQETYFGDIKVRANQDVEPNSLLATIDNDGVDYKDEELNIFSSESWLYMNTPYNKDEQKKIVYYTYEEDSNEYDWKYLQDWFVESRVQLYHKNRRNFKSKIIDYEKIFKPFTPIKDDFLESINPYTDDKYIITGFEHNIENGERKVEIKSWETFDFSK